ncbi:hypothetical protein [Mangrovimonas sp. YM274]|uniref:hypothetical protein n=1 Tax=Mangrovimonas sp. YM274 TaxID=3070660 RepID=UPI0027DB3591|nr:hypothetical protein [Mangrovimonas sp. YM274]WMI68878.1 hypothetical protein RBH95_00580 [Mangrovimonas sp. YM274]
MKKILVLCTFLLTVLSCSLDDDGSPSFYYEILPVESVDMPEEFVLGETYPIYLSYLKPSSCYVYNNLYYDSELNQRTIAIVDKVYVNDCIEYDEEEIEEVSFNFKVVSNGTYIFRFWQGEDENGNDLYYIVEVPVVE